MAMLKTFSTKAFGGFIELKRFEKKGQKWNKVIKHIVRIPEGCDDCIQYLRDLIHQDDTYRARDDYRYDHRFFYFMANNDRYKLSDKLEAKRQEIEYEFRPEQEEKTESAPYVAKTEDGAELNPANKGEKMFNAEARRDYLLDEARDLPYEVGRAVIDAMQYDEITEAVDRGLVETTDLKQVRDILMKRLRSMKANEIGDFVEQLIDLCTDDAIEDAYDML